MIFLARTFPTVLSAGPPPTFATALYNVTRQRAKRVFRVFLNRIQVESSRARSAFLCDPVAYAARAHEGAAVASGLGVSRFVWACRVVETSVRQARLRVLCVTGLITLQLLTLDPS